MLSSSSRLHDDYSTALVLTQASQLGHPGVKVFTFVYVHLQIHISIYVCICLHMCKTAFPPSCCRQELVPALDAHDHKPALDAHKRHCTPALLSVPNKE